MARVARDARGVDESVEATESVECRCDDSFGATGRAHVVGVRDGGAARGVRFRGNDFGDRGVAAGAVAFDARVVHDDAGALGRKQ
jgi:hypothetical protein